MSSFEVRGSNSGFMKGGQVYTNDQGACLRQVLVRSLSLPEKTPEGAFANVIFLGKLTEERWVAQNWSEEAEQEKHLAMQVTELTSFNGHADYVYPDCVVELKSVTSKRTHKEVFTKGKPKLNNLAQLVRYMTVAELPLGRLVYISYCDVIDYSELSFLTTDEVLMKTTKSAFEIKIFEVEFTQAGTILVDKKDSGWTVNDSLEHLYAAAEYLESPDQLPPRPVRSPSDPCFFCPLKQVCDNLAPDSSKQTFLDLAQTTLSLENE